jgi:hypothetical protein
MSASERPKDDTAGEPEEDGARRHTGNLADEKHPVPLFLRGRNDGRHGDEQDEKDGSAE